MTWLVFGILYHQQLKVNRCHIQRSQLSPFQWQVIFHCNESLFRRNRLVSTDLRSNMIQGIMCNKQQLIWGLGEGQDFNIKLSWGRDPVSGQHVHIFLHPASSCAFSMRDYLIGIISLYTFGLFAWRDHMITPLSAVQNKSKNAINMLWHSWSF